MANTLRFKRGLVSTIPTALAGEPLFTTDTFDLYIGNGTNNTRFQKYIASGTTSQLLRGDGSLLTMPIVLTSPANGQVLKYNGTSWVNDSDAGITGSGTTNFLPKFTGATTLGNSLVWDNGTNVGIGTTSASFRLDIRSTTATIASVSGGSSTNQGSAYYVHKSNVASGSLTAYGDEAAITGGSPDLAAMIFTSASIPLKFYLNGALRMTLNDSGRLLLGSSTDNGLRFQVTGDGYFSGSVGIGTTSLTGFNLRISKNITGGAIQKIVNQDGTVQSDVTNLAFGFLNSARTAAASFTLPNYYHFYAEQYTLGAGSAITNQFGFVADNTLTGATNNYGFYGNIASGTGRWNLYMNGTAANYLNGNLGVGITTPTARVEAVGVSGTTLIRATGADSNGNADVEIRSTGTTGASRLFFGDTAATSGSIIYNHASDAMLFSTAATTRATLDASGNLGLGVVPSAGSLWRQFEIGAAGASLTGRPSNTEIFLTQNAYHNNSNWIYKVNGTAAYFGIDAGDFRWYNAPSGTAAGTITFTERMRLFNATGNLTIGSTPTDAGFKLDVNGTMRVSDSATFTKAYTNTSDLGVIVSATISGINVRSSSNGRFSIITNYNAANTTSFVTGTGTNNPSSSIMLFDHTNLRVGIQQLNPAYTLDVNGTFGVSGASTFGGLMTISGSATTLLQITSTGAASYIGMGDSSGSLTYIGSDDGTFLVQTPGSSYSTKFSINSAGAATFSSSVTAGARFIVNSTSNAGVSDISLGSYVSGAWLNTPTSTIGYLAVGGSASIRWEANRQIFYIGGTEGMRFDGNLGVGTSSPSYKLDVTGEARVSNAIAIGTTPDTNKPFKILKNINGTVGINFENTSTGSSAFSAIQMGTDVTGGTKFTNLVYSSSGVTASGVYQPDGTSLINNGSGGLNFLGNPIRMYTGGSNGTLRWDMTNDGFITQYTGTNPSTNATDGYRQYSADVVAGNAAPHFRTENGAIIKLYQETTGVGNSIISLGGGNAVLDDTTFDGYTLRQIVKALRNQGILA